MGFLRRFRELLVVVLLLVVATVVYLSNRQASRDHNIVDRAVVAVTAPIQSVVVAGLDQVRSVWAGYFALVDTKKENDELKTRVAVLQGEIAARQEAMVENRRLQLLLGLKQRAPHARTIAASVVGTSPSPLFRSLRIDRGSDDGVSLGDAVAAPHGVVGRVAALAAGYADVMLVIDANQSLDALNQRTRTRLRVRGGGVDRSFMLDVAHLSRTADIEPGDSLITSGLGTVFPKGLRLGLVVSVARGKFGLYQEVEVQPHVDFRRLEEVLVIPQGWPADTNYSAVDDVQPTILDPGDDSMVTTSAVIGGTSAAEGHVPAGPDSAAEPPP